MKFVYSYKTSENQRRDGVISAPSRSAVYEELKKQRIRPFRVELAPGLWNRVRSIGWRWLAIGVLVVVTATLGMMLIGRDGAILAEHVDDTTRRQIIGDSFVIECGIRSGWAEVFDMPGDRYLASFALPGVPSAVDAEDSELAEVLDRPNRVRSDDGVENRQIKAIVSGMKDELRQYLKDGGSISEYRRELLQRQCDEVRYFTRAKTELEVLAKRGGTEEEIAALWEKRNRELRKMGIRTVPLP